MAFRIRRKRSINVIKVGVKIIATVIGLYASGIMLRTLGDVMLNSSSPFYTGLKLLGWTVGASQSHGDGGFGVCDGSVHATGTAGTTNNLSSSVANCITGTDGTGILAVIGLIAVVWVVFEFVDISM